MSESKLATFRIDSDVWEQFQAKAKTRETNASALIQRFIKQYIDGSIDTGIDASIDNNIDERIDAKLRELHSRIDGIDIRIDERFQELSDQHQATIAEAINSLRGEVESLKKPLKLVA